MINKAKFGINGIVTVVLLIIDVLYVSHFVSIEGGQYQQEVGPLMTISIANIFWGVYCLIMLMSNLNFSGSHAATEEERLKYKIDQYCPGCGKPVHVYKPKPDGFDPKTGKPSTTVIKISCESRVRGVESINCIWSFFREDLIS